MTAIILYRNDQARNMHRFYRIDVQPDLFAAWCLMREWGRIGSTGQTRSLPFPTPGRNARRARQAAQGKGTAGLRA